MAPLVLHQPHAGNISLAVADKDHAFERYWSLLLRHEFVDDRVVVNIEAALVDAEKILRLGCVVDCEGGPAGNSVMVEHEAGGVNLLELFEDLCSLNHLLDAR